jgi:hypothetical protein
VKFSFAITPCQRSIFQALNDRKKAETGNLTHLDSDTNARKVKIKKEPPNVGSGQCGTTNEGQNDQTDLKDEPGDFIETNCHWKDCATEFQTQDELVKVYYVHLYGVIKNEMNLLITMKFGKFEMCQQRFIFVIAYT